MDLPLSALSKQNHRQLVACFRASSGLFSDGQERAKKSATGWLRRQDSNFDAHHDARLIGGLLPCELSILHAAT